MRSRLTLLAVLALAACGKSGTCADTNDIEAFVFSQEIVTRALRAPRTASFPRITDAGVNVMQTDECVYAVGAYVDSQNGYGALVRSGYLVVMTYDPGSGTWSGSKPIMD